jgi:hypothetical protein
MLKVHLAPAPFFSPFFDGNAGGWNGFYDPDEGALTGLPQWRACSWDCLLSGFLLPLFGINRFVTLFVFI